MIYVLVWFFFSLFSAETRLLPPVMDDKESVVFLSKRKFSWNICSSYSLSYKLKIWYWNILIFSTIRIYCYRKQAWLSPFLLYNFIGGRAVIHVIFKNAWCMVLRYHMLHYFWYKQPFCFQIVRFLHRW